MVGRYSSEEPCSTLPAACAKCMCTRTRTPVLVYARHEASALDCIQRGGTPQNALSLKLACRTFQQCGTVLHIRSAEYTPDGRSLITTVGERRFRVLETRNEDGLTMAKIKFVQDKVIRPEETGACARVCVCVCERMYACIMASLCYNVIGWGMAIDNGWHCTAYGGN